MWFRRDLRIHDNTALFNLYQQIVARLARLNDTSLSVPQLSDSKTSLLPSQISAKHAGVSAIFFITPKQWLQHQQSLVQVDHILRTLPILKQHLLTQLGVQLHIYVADTFADCVDRLLDFCQQHAVHKVFANCEYELNEQQRDAEVSKRLQAFEVEFECFDDQCIVKPLSIVTKDNSMYQVFTPFFKRWQQHLQLAPINIQDVLANSTPTKQSSTTQSSTTDDVSHANNGHNATNVMSENSDYASVLSTYRQQWQQLTEQLTQQSVTDAQVDALLQHARQHYPAGEVEACYRLDQFIGEDIYQYDTSRDAPFINKTSQLSAYLAIGVLSPRLCYTQAQKAFHHSNYDDSFLNTANEVDVVKDEKVTGQGKQGEKDVQRWISELAWRDFYRHVLVARPDLIKHQAYHVATDTRVNWSYDEDNFKRWCVGNTGFPMIDAAMRCLNATGFMHNRLRMVVAMFLTKDLLIDWRWGEAYFMQLLIDADFASNNGGWQWSASTGTDAAPYFRIMNPFSQSKTHDKEAEFIKQWLPELTTVKASILHDEGKLRKFLANNPHIDYPLPMVEHKVARLMAIEQFKQK